MKKLNNKKWFYKMNPGFKPISYAIQKLEKVIEIEKNKLNNNNKPND